MSPAWLLYFVKVIFIKALFECDKNQCSYFALTDNICTPACNTVSCNFDTPVPCTDTSVLDFFLDLSDCSQSCLSPGICNVTNLANAICDADCNTAECGWDLGDCGYCSPGCTIDLLTNDVCDPICSNLPCMFDNNLCGWCAVGCFEKDLYSSACIPECNVTACQAYGSNPCYLECSPGCTREMLGDGSCNLECCVEECWYDYGDCLCSPGCTPEIIAESTCIGSTDPCATEQCNFKNGLCGGCALGCTDDMLGNGICESECNRYECNYDYMDCGCAPGCLSFYDAVGGWTWDTSDSENCLVPACMYNYGRGFSDAFLVREHILTQIIARNWSFAEILSHPECDNSALVEYDAGATCSFGDPCNNRGGMYCVGIVCLQIPACLRNNGKECIICDCVMVMDVCANSITDCPCGYQDQAEINQLFSGVNLRLCLREPEVFNPYNYQEYYVSPSNPPYSTGTGTVSDPFMSLYYAFTQYYATFTKILISAGDYFYQIDVSLNLPLVKNRYDPLNTNSALEFYELWIIGDPTSMSVVFWKEKLMVSPKAYKTFIQNIIFRGDQILRNNCTGDFEYCYYCPILTIADSIITTD